VVSRRPPSSASSTTGGDSTTHGDRVFGTDGVRGLANGSLTAELALDLSVAAAHILGEAGAFEGHRPRAVVGRDTRISGEFLEAAVVAGLASAGVDVLRLGVLPTPGVAYLTGALNVDLGVMISASHNPMPDNGIKFLSRGGVKLPDALEHAIEGRMREPWDRPTGAKVGRITTYDAAVNEYAEHLCSTVPVSLAGLKVVVDCAHGAAFRAAPRALCGAGAEVVAVCAEPDGLNINEGCGSTHLEVLQAAVLEHGADVGFALDGDADRCLAVDHEGTVVDGDQILAILALALRDSGHLVDDTVVATVMSNLGFVQAMEGLGIRVEQTKVGDRYVLESMNTHGFVIGGEQSGHVILSQHATTGDGTLTALQVLARMAATGRSLRDLAAVMTRLPQVLVNVSGVDKKRAGSDEQLAAAVAEEEAGLAGSGRVLLRPSGTESLVRVMVEAATAEQAQQVADRLARVVRDRLAL
jgi:phosphoglucosamine mutase